jgi:putative ABC transport system permease protein
MREPVTRLVVGLWTPADVRSEDVSRTQSLGKSRAGVLNAGIIIGVVCGVLILALLISALRNPILRRLAVRNALSWPASAVLIVFGTMIGTAMITGSLVVGDNVRDWVYRDVERRLGEIDQIIFLPDPQPSLFPTDLTESITIDRINGVLESDGSNASVNGVLPVIQQSAPGRGLDAADGEITGVSPEIMVIAADWDELARFGNDPPQTSQLASGRAVISEEVAESLNLTAGDTLQVIAGERTGDFTVDTVVPARGVAGYGGMGWEGIQGAALIGLEDGQNLFADGEAAVNAIFVSHQGAVTQSQRYTSDVRAALETLLRDSETHNSFQIIPIKDQVMADATFVPIMFLIFSSFVILAGIALTVNIYVSLAEERRSNMGITRALGMRRGHLVRLYLYEGLIYSTGAAIVGALVGLGLARVIVLAIDRLFDFIDLAVFVLRPDSLLSAALAGMLISMGTVFFTSLRTSHVNIVAAMRGLADPKRTTRSRWSMIWPALTLLGGAALSLVAISTNNVVAWILGPALLIIGLGFGVRASIAYFRASRIQPRLVLTVAFLSAMIYVWLTNEFSSAVQREHENSPLAFLLMGLVLIFGGVGVIALNLSLILKPLQWLSTRARRALPMTRMAVAYPGGKPVRTSFTILMFTIVLFVVTLMHVMIGLFSEGAEGASTSELGGFEVMVFPNPVNPLPDLEEQIRASDAPDLAGIERVTGFHIAQLTLPEYRMGDYIGWHDRDAVDREGPLREEIIGVDETFLLQTRTVLSERAPVFASDQEVWAAMAENPDLIVVDHNYQVDGIERLRPAFEPGDTINLGSPETGISVEKQVAGVMQVQFFWETPVRGILINAEALREDFGADRFHIPTMYLLGLESGADDQAIAAAIEREFVEAGVQALSIGGILEEEQQWLGFLRIIQGFLAFGLFVGVAGLAVVATRAVHQRRRDIGTLRALGFRRGMILGYFLVESSIVALIGILLGTGIGSLASIIIYRYVLPEAASIEFFYPTTAIVLTSLGIFVVALAFTVIPAIRASNLPVVDALRPIE